MSGGYNRAAHTASTELFLPSTGKTCSLAEGPRARDAHTLNQLGDGLIACGGAPDNGKMCHQFVPSLPYGKWAMSATLRKLRTYHTSVVLGGKLLLLGGLGWGDNTAEVVGGDQSEGFNLQQNTRLVLY